MEERKFEKISDAMDLVAVWLGFSGLALWFDAVASSSLWIDKEVQIVVALSLVGVALAVVALRWFAHYRRYYR